MLQAPTMSNSKPRTRRGLLPVGIAIGLALVAGSVTANVLSDSASSATTQTASGCAANHYMYGHNLSSCSHDIRGLRKFAGTTFSGCVVGALGGPEAIAPGCVGGMVGAINW